jgi:hypothetical protein
MKTLIFIASILAGAFLTTVLIYLAMWVVGL